MFSARQPGNMPSFDMASLLDAATYHTKHDDLARIWRGSLQKLHSISGAMSSSCACELVSILLANTRIPAREGPLDSVVAMPLHCMQHSLAPALSSIGSPSSAGLYIAIICCL